MVGKASIISTGEPDSFVPGVEFRVRPTLTNVGGDGTLWVHLIDKYTGAFLAGAEIYVSAGRNWVPSLYVTLTQTTDFHGRLQAGHVEGMVIDHTKDFTVPVAEVSCTASFQETSVEVGATIHANFTWSNAIYRGFPYYHYAVMNIKDPNGNVRAQHFELTNSSGSKPLSCVTDMAGTWTCQIGVWQGVFYISCSDTVPVSADEEWTLDEALTCKWVDGYNDHGPRVTEFDIDQVVYAYSEIHGPDMYGHTVRHEWWYKEAGATEFTKKWTYNWTCGGHYTEWAQWTWWEIGLAYGPGEGYIAVYFDDVFLGKTNNYTIIGGAIGEISIHSKYYTGPFNPGANEYIMRVFYGNRYDAGDGTIYYNLYEYPNTPSENLLQPNQRTMYPGQSETWYQLWKIPPTGPWPLGIKVWGDGETEPSWGAAGTKIFKIRQY